MTSSPRYRKELPRRGGAFRSFAPSSALRVGSQRPPLLYGALQFPSLPRAQLHRSTALLCAGCVFVHKYILNLSRHPMYSLAFAGGLASNGWITPQSSRRSSLFQPWVLSSSEFILSFFPF